MKTPLKQKSTTHQIRDRFQKDVERFSNLETGQSATIDAPLAMELITEAAVASTPEMESVLDVGCGAGNNSLKLRMALNRDIRFDLLDLSEAMLSRAEERLAAVNKGAIRTFNGDFRAIELDDNSYDVILAAAVLHHLRDDSDWEFAFRKIYKSLRPGGSVWITDLVSHESAAVHQMMWHRYGVYLTSLKDAQYRDEVFRYIDQEDSPRSVTYQMDLLRKVGFDQLEILHKNSCFAAFGAIKR